MLPTGLVTRGRANPLHQKFPERLRRARKAAGFTASGLSLAAGINKNAVAGLEEGLSSPRLPTVEQLARVLRVSPGWLAYGLSEQEVPAEPDTPRCAGLRDRLRDAAEQRGLSLREVARRADAGEGVAVAVARGTMPSLSTLEDLARALGVSPAWLAFGEGPRELPRRGSRRAAEAAVMPETAGPPTTATGGSRGHP